MMWNWIYKLDTTWSAVSFTEFEFELLLIFELLFVLELLFEFEFDEVLALLAGNCSTSLSLLSLGSVLTDVCTFRWWDARDCALCNTVCVLCSLSLSLSRAGPLCRHRAVPCPCPWLWPPCPCPFLSSGGWSILSTPILPSSPERKRKKEREK